MALDAKIRRDNSESLTNHGQLPFVKEKEPEGSPALRDCDYSAGESLDVRDLLDFREDILASDAM